MKITCKLFATLREHLPAGAVAGAAEIEAPEGATVEEVLRQNRVPMETKLIVMINGVHGGLSSQLREGDVLAVFPPVAGG